MDVLQRGSLKIAFLSSKGMTCLFESYRCSETLKEKAIFFFLLVNTTLLSFIIFKIPKPILFFLIIFNFHLSS